MVCATFMCLNTLMSITSFPIGCAFSISNDCFVQAALIDVYDKSLDCLKMLPLFYVLMFHSGQKSRQKYCSRIEKPNKAAGGQSRWIKSIFGTKINVNNIAAHKYQNTKSDIAIWRTTISNHFYVFLL